MPEADPARNAAAGGALGGKTPPGPLARLRRIVLIGVAGGSACTLLAALGFELANRSEPGAGAEAFAYRRGDADGALPRLWNVPDFSFEDQNRNRVTPGTLSGKVWIANFIFTTCTSVCPLLSAKMVVLQHRLRAPDLGFVSFSVDPVHDQPAVMHDYAEQWNASETRWHLLSTDPKGLAATVDGMRVALEPTGDADNPIMHSSMFFLIDAQGSVRGVYDSADDQALGRLASDASALLGPATAPEAMLASGAMSAPEAALDPGGERLYATLGCAACHDNQKLAPSLRGAWGGSVKLADGQRAQVDAEFVRRAITAPGAQLSEGYLNIMPSYADVLSPAQIDGLVRHVQSLAAPDAMAALAALPPAAVARSESAPPATLGAARDAPAVTGVGVVTDPVCQMSVRVAADTPHVQLDGHDHYFCSESCRDRFAANPKKYLH